MKSIGSHIIIIISMWGRGYQAFAKSALIFWCKGVDSSATRRRTIIWCKGGEINQQPHHHYYLDTREGISMLHATPSCLLKWRATPSCLLKWRMSWILMWALTLNLSHFIWLGVIHFLILLVSGQVQYTCNPRNFSCQNIINFGSGSVNWCWGIGRSTVMDTIC